MKVGIVSHNRCGLNAGGLQTQIAMTKEALEGLGHDVYLWNPWHGVKPHGFDVAHFFSTDASLFQVHRVFRERRIPTVLSPVLGAANVSTSVKRFRNFLATSPLPIYQDLHRAIGLVREADLAIVLTEAEEELCQALGRKGDTTRIPNGVGSCFGSGDPKSGARLAQTERYFMHVGHFWPNKGQRWLIENWTRPDTALILVGEPAPGHQAYFEDCLRAAEGRPIRIIQGLRPASHELADLYAAALGLILNSGSEVAPLVINEAVASGTPVILPDHLIATALYPPEAVFRHGDVRSFYDALSSVRRPEAGRRVPSWGDVGQMLSRAYEQLAIDGLR